MLQQGEEPLQARGNKGTTEEGNLTSFLNEPTWDVLSHNEFLRVGFVWTMQGEREHKIALAFGLWVVPLRHARRHVQSDVPRSARMVAKQSASD